VLLLHAWVESSACFDRLLQQVPPTLRVFAIDQRGHGDADKPANGYALVNFADDVEAFMDAVGLQSAVLLGSSSGGYVAQQVAVQVPYRVDGLVLVGAPRSLQGRPAFADEVDQLTDTIDPSWVEESLTWFPRYHAVPDWYIKDWVALLKVGDCDSGREANAAGDPICPHVLMLGRNLWRTPNPG
jgi:pimeloyl-ACP methyl ester carboxylesterase